MADNTGNPTMHPDFPRWYREVNVEENRDRYARRWAGVATLAEEMDAEDVETALRVVYRARRSGPAEALGRIREFFKKADELFDMQDNDREMEILCGSSLAVLLHEDNGDNEDFVTRTALAITTTAFDGIRAAQLPLDLLTLAETVIVKFSESQRKRPIRSTISFKKAQAALSQFDSAGVSNAFDRAAEAINKAFASADRFIAIQDEELDMLWWVLNERSEDLGQPFGQLPAKAKPLVLAKELADITAFLPGPVSSKGLLGRAGLSGNKKVVVADAVNECDLSWLKSLSMPDPLSPLTHPLHAAIARRIETGDTTSWVAGWANTTGISEKQTLATITLGSLFYRERLLSTFTEE